MSHRAGLWREQQPVDAGLFHAIELALHRARDLLVADGELGTHRLGEVGDLLAAVGLKLRRRRGEMSVSVDDHLEPPKSSNRSSRSTAALRSNRSENEVQDPESC